MCWRTTEKISWTDREKNEELLHRVKEERKTLKIKKVKWICHTLHRNCLLKHVIEGRIEVRGRR